MSLAVGIVLFGIIVVVVYYATTLVCNHEYSSECSEWQVIRYSGSSIEPKEIYICKRCNNKRNLNYHYCDNCGAQMKNGISYQIFKDKIELSE